MTTSDDTQDDTGATQDPADPSTGSDGSAEAGSTDTGSTESDSTDTGSTESDSTDADSTDADSTDSSSTDADSTDASSTDASSTDADSTNAGSTDADSTDTDNSDTSTTDDPSSGSATDDAGSTDAGSTDAGDADSDPAASEADDGATAAGDDSGTTLPADEATGATDTNPGDGTGDSASSSAPVDLGPPYLIVDQYSGDSGMNPPWTTLVGLPQFYGAILKAWEGTAFNDGGWFAHNWPAVRQAGADRYGSSWFRGAYLFLKFNASGAAQADAYLKAVDAAGGWDSGDILPVVDVELGGATNSNHAASKQQVIDCVGQCTARLKEATGRRVMLYGRGAMRDLHIADKMGADVAWNPSYTPTMHKAGLEGFTLDEIVLWQYCGDNESYLPNYPHQVKGFAKLDISVFIKGRDAPTLDDVRSGLLT